MQTDQHHAVMGDGDAHEIMRFVSCPDCAMGSLYAGSTPNQPFHQTPKSVALVNFHVPEARGRASGMASYAALSAFGLRRCAPQEPNARAAGSASLPRLKARIDRPDGRSARHWTEIIRPQIEEQRSIGCGYSFSRSDFSPCRSDSSSPTKDEVASKKN